MSRDSSREITGLDESIGKKINGRESTTVACAADQMVMMSGRGQNINSFGQLLYHPGISTMMTTSLNTITPCAACKLLRRRCAEECPFSPYFSPHEPHKFSAVHKVYGASNVSKLLMEVPENQRADAANSLVYEANVRLRDPVYGCMGVISSLQEKIQFSERQLDVARKEIYRYQCQEAAVAAHSHHHAVSAALFSCAAGSRSPSSTVVSIAAAPPQSSPLAAPPSSVVFSSSSSTSACSLYTPSTNTTGYSSLSSDNLPFFD